MFPLFRHLAGSTISQRTAGGEAGAGSGWQLLQQDALHKAKDAGRDAEEEICEIFAAPGLPASEEANGSVYHCAALEESLL